MQASPPTRSDAGQKPSKPSFSQKDIRNFGADVKKFLNCWYVKHDERCYFDFISKKAPAVDYRSFKDIFDGEPVISSTFRIHIGYIEVELNERGVKCLNNTQTDGFCVMSGQDWAVVYQYLMDTPDLPPEIENAGPFLLVLYVVEGLGYKTTGVVSTWVKEEFGWKTLGSVYFE